MPAGRELTRILPWTLPALLLFALTVCAAPNDGAPLSGLSVPRLAEWISTLPDEEVPEDVPPEVLPPVEEDPTLEEALARGESSDPPELPGGSLEDEGAKSYAQIKKYATKKLENVRIAVSIFNFPYIVMKRGTAGWGHYDQLFESGVLFTKLTLGASKIPLPLGGFEISYIGMPFYQILLGGFYEIYTGKHWLGNKFDDLVISNVYLGFRLNIFNENTALQKWGEMFEYDRPKHFLGINIYLKAAVFLAFYNRVKASGAFTVGHYDTYFNQTETLGYFVLAGFEYRFYTLGLFFETGWKYTHKPTVAQPLISVNHFRTFPINMGLTIYFGG